MSATLEDEARRLYLRYAAEVVEALGLCPYAERARIDGRTRETVVLGAPPDDAGVLEAVEAMVDDEAVEVGFVILPELVVDQPPFHRWVEDLRKRHAAARGRTLMAIEGFHPHGRGDLSRPERLVPTLRRTPDPTLQLTRLSVLEHLKRGAPGGTAFMDPSKVDVRALLSTPPSPRPVHERIAEANGETVRAFGLEALEARLDALLVERDRAYLRFGIPPRQV